MAASSSMQIRHLIDVAKDIYSASKAAFKPDAAQTSNANNQPINPLNHLTKLLEHNSFKSPTELASAFWRRLHQNVDNGFLDVQTTAHGEWSNKTKSLALQSMLSILQNERVKVDFKADQEFHKELVSLCSSKAKELLSQYHKGYKNSSKGKRVHGHHDDDIELIREGHDDPDEYENDVSSDDLAMSVQDSEDTNDYCENSSSNKLLVKKINVLKAKIDKLSSEVARLNTILDERVKFTAYLQDLLLHSVKSRA